MYAVVRTGGKQYRVSENARIEVEKLAAEPGEAITLDSVLMIGGGDDGPTVGAPLIENAAVRAEVVEHKRDAKILIFKKKRRKNHRRLKGHRQPLTVLRITGIDLAGTTVAGSAAAKKTKKSKPATSSEDDTAAATTAPTDEAAPKPKAKRTTKKAPAKAAADAPPAATETPAEPATTETATTEPAPAPETGAGAPADDSKPKE